MKVKELVSLKGCYSAHDVGELDVPWQRLDEEKVHEELQRLDQKMERPGNYYRAKHICAKFAQPVLERLDEKKLYDFLKSIDGCNIAHLDTEWADIVNINSLAKAICSRLSVPAFGIDVEEIIKVLDNFQSDELGTNSGTRKIAQAIADHLRKNRK